MPQIQEQIVEVINDFERRAVVQQLLTGVFWEVVVRLQRHERQHGWTCPQPPGAEC